MKNIKPESYAFLCEALLSLENSEEVSRFLTDLCTPGEIQNFVERLDIAHLLDKKELSYREIAAKTGASTTTVARVGRFLNQEPYNGYRLILDRLGKKAD